MLRSNQTLTNLKLGHNFLGNRGGSTIVEALTFNTTLQTLDISGKNINFYEIV